MIMKLKIEGELLDFLTEDAERNRRSRPQQLLYYIQERARESNQYDINTNTKIGTERGSQGLQRGQKSTKEVELNSMILNF